MKELLKKISRLEMELHTVLIPYSEGLGRPKPVCEGVIDVLEKGTILKEVMITTNKGSSFDSSTKALNELVNKFIEDNEICIDY